MDLTTIHRRLELITAIRNDPDRRDLVIAAAVIAMDDLVDGRHEDAARGLAGALATPASWNQEGEAIIRESEREADWWREVG